MKKFLIPIAKWFKSIKVCGRQRFWFLYWAYRITGWHIRHKEWDFILEYLPHLHSNKQNVRVLDVGCSRNLFSYELVYRGYDLVGVDIEEPKDFAGKFVKDSIVENRYAQFDIVTCISVLEHIGDEGRGDLQQQEFALENMIGSLNVGGRLLLTCPTKEFAQGHIWHGFTWQMIVNALERIPIKVRAVESTERAGQLCMAIERCA